MAQAAYDSEAASDDAASIVHVGAALTASNDDEKSVCIALYLLVLPRSFHLAI